MSEQDLLQANILALAERDTWLGSADLSDESVLAWLGEVKHPDLARVYFVGCGTSLYAGQVGKHVVERLVHVPCEAVQAFAFATYAEDALLGPRTLVVGISATGGSAAVYDALMRARQAGAPTLVVTVNAESRVAQVADDVIRVAGPVTVSVKTKTYVQTLVALYVLAARLAENLKRDDAGLLPYWREQMDVAADSSQRLLADRQTQIEQLAQRYAAAPHTFVLGSGPNDGTVQEGALKLAEMAKICSKAHDLENFLHGRLREVGPDTPLCLIAPQGLASARVLDFLTVTDHIGAPSVVLTDDVTPGIRRLATDVIHVPGHLDELATPLLYILPLYLLGYHMALARGYDPAARRYADIVPQNVRYREAG